MESWNFQSYEHFLSVIDCSKESLKSILSKKSEFYNLYNKNKKNGVRTIYAIRPKSELYMVQQRLQRKFLSNVYLPDTVCGFRSDYSYIDFLTPHISQEQGRFYLRLDISDFFDSIQVYDLKEALDYYISDDIEAEERKKLLSELIDIVTVDEVVVQGAVTSPMISNLVFRKLDIRIERYCSNFNIKYTRYADDMLFSGSTNYIHNRKFMSAISNIISSHNFSLNYNKTLRFKNEISLNGFVVGNKLRISRSKLYELNKIMRLLKSKEQMSRKVKYRIRNQLAGYRAFLIQVMKSTEDEREKRKLKNKIDSIQRLMKKHESTLD